MWTILFKRCSRRSPETCGGSAGTGAGDGFRKWLWGVTRNKILQFWGQQAKLPHAGGSAVRTIPETPPEETDAHEAAETRLLIFSRALERLQTEFQHSTWQAFWRTTVNEQPGVRVAQELGISVGAVYTAKSRVLKRVREEFGELLERAPEASHD